MAVLIPVMCCRAQVGPDAAHLYTPHCTITGHFNMTDTDKAVFLALIVRCLGAYLCVIYAGRHSQAPHHWAAPAAQRSFIPSCRFHESHLPVLGWLLLPNILGLKVLFAEGKHVADELQKQVAAQDPMLISPVAVQGCRPWRADPAQARRPHVGVAAAKPRRQGVQGAVVHGCSC